MPPLIVMLPLAALVMAASDMPIKLVEVRLVDAGVKSIPDPLPELFPSRKFT